MTRIIVAVVDKRIIVSFEDEDHRLKEKYIVKVDLQTKIEFDSSSFDEILY